VVDSIVSAFHWFRDSLYALLKFYQGLIEPALGEQSYWVAIVMLTLTIRVLLIPLVSKQVRSQRAMAELAPELKKLQAKHKDDRQKLNQEMMALYQDRGVNPMMGCLPLLVQAPFFIALYHVMFQQEIAGERNLLLGHGFFGIPLDTRWWALGDWSDRLLSVDGIVILVLILLQGAVMFLSMRQMMSKQSMATANPQAQQMQAMMLRVMPVMLIVIGVNFPLAVLIYWVSTNLWQWGQQTVMLRTHPIKTPDATDENADGKAPAKSGKPAERPKGLFAGFRAQLAEAAQQRNGSSGDTTKSKDGTKDGAETATNGSDGSTQGTGAPRRRRSADSGRKTTSSPRSGGGKGGAGNRQRRRKR
jgi:YidC/Oxa1 family membrane protein insertase